MHSTNTTYEVNKWGHNLSFLFQTTGEERIHFPLLHFVSFSFSANEQEVLKYTCKTNKKKSTKIDLKELSFCLYEQGWKINKTTGNSCCPKHPLLGNKAVTVSVTPDLLKLIFGGYSFLGNDNVDLYLDRRWWHYLSSSWHAQQTQHHRRRLPS